MNEVCENKFEELKIEEIPKYMQSLYEDLTELQHQIKLMDIESVRILFNTELKNTIDHLKIAYKTEIEPLPLSTFRTDLEALLYNLFGASFFD